MGLPSAVTIAAFAWRTTPPNALVDRIENACLAPVGLRKLAFARDTLCRTPATAVDARRLTQRTTDRIFLPNMASLAPCEGG